MISEGSCDTEDWSNDAENSALHQHIYITFIYLADAFIQSDLQLLFMSEVARLWSN